MRRQRPPIRRNNPVQTAAGPVQSPVRGLCPILAKPAGGRNPLRSAGRRGGTVCPEKKGDILPSPPDRKGALFASMPESASARHTALSFRDRLRRRPALLFPQPCTSAHRKLCDHSKKNGRNCQGITACLPQSRRKVRKQRSSSGSPPCSAPYAKTGFDRGPLRLRRIGSGESGFDGKTSRRKPLRRPSEAGSTADQPFLPHICPFSRPY